LSVLADNRMQYFGLTYWSPNINIFRDPRWGRGQETYGEDPFLTGRMGAAYIGGMQGDNPLHLKTAACAKHFAVHSGPEAIRHSFNAVVDEKDLRETYLYAFRKAVNAGVASVMTAYNAVNGVPCPINSTLMDILKKEWHFNGYILNDCGALDDIISGHKTMSDPVEVAAAAIKAGIDLDCGGLLQHAAMKAVERHLLTEREIDSSLLAILNTEFKLGFYDGKEKDPYHHYGADSIHNAWHIALAKKMAAESIVLLKNDGVLPLKKNLYKTILVTGPSAGSLDALVGSYHGVSNHLINFVEGITGAAGPAVGVQYDLGCNNTDTVHFGGVWASSNSDITIAAIGLTPVMEGEEGDAFLSPNAKGDRKNLQLPVSQVAFIKALRKASSHPLIAVVTGGSDIDLSSIEPYVDAIIMAWYPGEQGGTALADVLFGKVSPAGRLPVTFYQSADELSSFTDYRMQGRTYRYFKGKVEYPFGFGLSYTSFTYSWNKEPLKTYKAGDTIALSVIVRNTGKMNGDEVVQCYVEYPDLPRMPVKELKQFRRVGIQENGMRTVDMRIPVSELKKWDMQHNSWKLYSGPYRIIVGSNSMDQRLVAGFNIE
ncbi:MAG TPA: glycoside hydrolase family 3 C-terminal domain-containing protein, partial [Chitinophagaceae bacterium]